MDIKTRATLFLTTMHETGKMSTVIDLPAKHFIDRQIEDDDDPVTDRSEYNCI